MKLCFEQKRYPSGHQNHFQARPLIVRPGVSLLFFVSKRAYQLQHIYLPIKTVTFGFYWSDKLYNLYVFVDPEKFNVRAFYFNVCDEVMISAGQVNWRDLWVDVLVMPCKDTIILDEDEIYHYSYIADLNEDMNIDIIDIVLLINIIIGE